MENKNRYILYVSHSSKQTYDEMERLGKLYKDIYKKNLTVDLFFSDYGQRISTQYGITVYFQDQFEELNFLKENISKQ